MQFDQQWHGYRRGHQLLSSTFDLSARDQDLVDKLSDASGAPRLGEHFEPYLTIYPLPSGQFHIVARTWQDLAAPRSGTVFTKSLLIPTSVWKSLRKLRPVFLALDDREISTDRATISDDQEFWPPPESLGLIELTEAFFLERAVPIAGFGFRDAEAVVGRLVESLWPDRRANLAVCTYALAPRSLSDRDFDLVFAPDSARSRFAKWDGRRISATTATSTSRHSWTPQIVDRIFRSPEPRLQDLDELGLFGPESSTDGSALRLALLWGDLKATAPTSPKSLLGMLDILSSIGRQPWEVQNFREILAASLKATSHLQAGDAWQFLQILARKLGGDVPLSIVRDIFNATKKVAKSAPGLIADIDAETASVSLPHLLRPAVATGLAELSVSALSDFFTRAQPGIIVALMSESPSFSFTAAQYLSENRDGPKVAVLASLANDDPRAARRIAAGVARGARSSEIAPLLRVALTASARQNFGYLANEVVSVAGRPRPEVITALLDSARSLSAQDTLRFVALEARDEEEGDALLLNLMRDRADATWLIETLTSDEPRLYRLLAALMRGWSDNHLRDVAGTGRNKDALLGSAILGLPASVTEFRRVLAVLPPSPRSTLAVLRQASARLPKKDLVSTVLVVLDQIFSLDPGSYQDILADVLALADPSKIINSATSTALSGRQVGANLAAVASSKSSARFAHHIDVITAKLVARRAGDYGRDGYDGWATLLRAARKEAPEALVRSADPALNYSIGRRGEPAGAVVAATFPIVHARLAKKSNIPEVPFNLFTAIFYASIALFTDWDKAKEARHGIVDAFLRSTWEPAELLRAGVDAKIQNKLLGYLVTRKGGREYLRKIERSVSSYPDPTRKLLKAALSDFQ